MATYKSEKEHLIDVLLETLEYQKPKEVVAITKHLRSIFRIPTEKELRDHLLTKVDFSELFVELLKIAEPFVQMINEIYAFLAEHRKTARALEHLIVGENIQNSISFNLQDFPHIYQPILQQIGGYLLKYNPRKIRNSNISPLFRTESLLGCGHCVDPHYQKNSICQQCDVALQARLRSVLRQLEEMIGMLSDEEKLQDPFNRLCNYFDTANKHFSTGTHWKSPCRGYAEWDYTLREIERRIKQVSQKYKGTYNTEVLVKFFELPFWKQQSRLYEIWTLIHFIKLLKGTSFDLNIKNNQWLLMYGEASEPVAWIRGYRFEIEVHYQYRLKTGLKAFQDDPIEPEMLFILHNEDRTSEVLALIECKARKDYTAREIKKNATFYRSQSGANLNIFCNYYDYTPSLSLEVSSDTPVIMVCGQFRPGCSTMADVDNEFVKTINNKIGIFLQAVLIDISGSMAGKDVKAVYQDLHTRLASLHGSKSRGGIFANQVKLYDYDMLINALQSTPSVGGGTDLKPALIALQDDLLKNTPHLKVVNYYVITDIEFGEEDWQWLKSVDADRSYTITFVAKKEWVNDDTRKLVDNTFRRVKILFL